LPSCPHSIEEGDLSSPTFEINPSGVNLTSHEAERIPALIIGDNQNNIWALGRNRKASLLRAKMLRFMADDTLQLAPVGFSEPAETRQDDAQALLSSRGCSSPPDHSLNCKVLRHPTIYHSAISGSATHNPSLCL
jgi:hypothetical protein